MKFTKFAAALVFAGIAAISSVQAAAPIELAIWAPDLQLAGADADVAGLRLSIYGENKDVKGIDFGFVNVAKGDFKGISFNYIYQKIDGDYVGAGFNGICTRVGGDSVGVNWSLINICRGDFKGVGLGLFNKDFGKMTGVQWGFIDSAGTLNGLQFGFVNCADSLHGVQLGLLNWAESGCGLQVGLVNILKDGFLPVFPFINFNF